MNKIQTLIINLWGGPGVGKSVAAAWLFSELKQLNINAELVTEYAKDKVWEESHKVLHDQIYVFAKQQHRLKILLDKVDVIVNDSPIIMGIVYDQTDNQHLKNLAIHEYFKMNSLDFLIKRETIFQQEGRRHDEDQSLIFDKKIEELIKSLNISITEISPNKNSYKIMLDKVLKFLK